MHTLVWAFFAGCVVAIPVAALLDEYRLAAWMAFAVLVEVLVLVFNRMRCPLTAVAARYTSDRRDNFDIYLPEWLARNTKLLFGSLYVGGVLFALLRWVQR